VVEHFIGNEEVGSSILLVGSINNNRNGGSIPPLFLGKIDTLTQTKIENAKAIRTLPKNTIETTRITQSITFQKNLEFFHTPNFGKTLNNTLK
jgi:hypothetical protein